MIIFTGYLFSYNFIPAEFIVLQKLSIKNYAIISGLEIPFGKGLNIITGETGAGKSIIVGAMGLILGDRADTSVLLSPDQKCVVEGAIDIKGKKGVFSFLENEDLDASDVLIIRREINPNGKSRAFINDTPVNLQQLNELAAVLVDLHQQFGALELSKQDFQLTVIDGLAKTGSLLQEYEVVFSDLEKAKEELSELKKRQETADKETDYFRFLYHELEEINLSENELEELENELNLLSNAEGIKNALMQAGYLLSEGEQPLTQQLKNVLQQLGAFEKVHPQLEEINKRLASTQIELNDIASDIARLNDTVHFDPERMERIQERLDAGYKLQKKHGVQSTNALLQVKNELEEKLQEVMSLHEIISGREKEANRLLAQAQNIAEALTVKRTKELKPFEQKVNKLLQQVGMPNAKIKVTISKEEALKRYGQDLIEFLFDANNTGRFEPVRRVASGGELSRLMLCIKSLVAKSIDLPVLIFDEIDTGISGEAARQVGMLMKELSSGHQVISITHQPQIAAKADHHFLVFKKEINKKISAQVKELMADERVDAIARMLSGEKISEASIKTAREMVDL